jgi:hypothetical protein
MWPAAGQATGTGRGDGHGSPHRAPAGSSSPLTDEEHEVVQAAAQRAGLAPAAYAAKTVLAAAANGSTSDPDPHRQALTELMRAAGLARRIGTNLTQAATALTAAGQPAGDLPAYAATTMRRADHIDEIAEDVRKALR